MSAIKLTIDGRPVEVRPGTTILEAARQLGIDIPTFCHDPELAPNGACRICVVEVERARALVASCCAPVGPDMVVHTESERVVQARTTILRLILANHPLECITCEKTGQCKLQDYCYRYGISASNFDGEVKELPLDDTNPFYIRDMNKCILCGRCIRTCDSLARYHAIDFQNRGIKAMVQPPVGRDLEHSDCTFCGQCVQLCPVGALSEKASAGQGRPWELESVKSTCSYCGVGCELNIQVNRKTGRIANVTTDYQSPTGINEGRCCVKGRFAWQYVHSEDRLTRPLIKENGSFREAGWAEALSVIAGRMNAIKEDFGSDAVGFFSSARCTNEENFLLQRLSREVMGTNNVDHCAHL